VNPHRPTILFLVHRIPHPPNRGDRIRSFHVLRFLAARADVHLAFLTDAPPPEESLTVLRGLCRRVAAVRLGRRRRWVEAASCLTRGRTATEGLFHSNRLEKIVADWARDTRFDAVVVFCSSMIQYAGPALRPSTRLLVDLVDVDSQKWFDYAETSRGLKRFLFALEGRRLRQLEGSLPKRADAITVVSQHEADLYRRFCPSDRIHVITNGVALDYFQPQGLEQEAEPARCVFVGALDYRANLDGAAWFVEHVWPHLRQDHPGARFQLVGSNPGLAARRLADAPGVELVGQVDDVRPWLAKAAVAVAPLRGARGIQNKVLEALAMGKAVVATPQAVEGLAVQSGVHLCEAATPGDWVRTLGALLSDPARRAELGRAGRAFVEAHHRWDSQLAAFTQLPGLADLNWAEPAPMPTEAPRPAGARREASTGQPG